MTRRFIDDIRTDINTLMADNNTGDITPLIQRGVLLDMCDSLIQDETGIVLDPANAPIENIPVGTGWSILQAYDTAVGGDGIWLKPDFSAGQIETNTQPGWSYQVWGGVSFIGSNNDRFDFAISYDGVPSEYIQSATGQGNGDPVSVAVRGFILSNTPDQRVGISIRTDDPGDIDVTAIAVLVTVLPTNNP